MDPRIGHMSAATADKKASETQRRAEALRANLRRRKAAVRPTVSADAAGPGQDNARG